ncbi:MAG: hypothetical protein Tsb0020_03740 [Haliangiales bacterium]
MDDSQSLLELAMHELIARAQGGERAAIEALFERAQPTIAKWTEEQRRAQPSTRAGLDRPSDIAQETAVIAYRKFRDFRGSTEQEWFAWLRRIHYNRTSEAWRTASRQKRSMQRTVPLDASKHDRATGSDRPSAQLAQKRDWKLLLTYIFELPQAQKQAVWLCHLKELPVVEVARRLDKSEAAIAGLLRRALKTLRDRASHAAEPPATATANVSATAQSPRDAQRDHRVAEAILSYLQRRDAGDAIDREQLARTHSDIADDLRELLEWIERIEAICAAEP